ncbi:hypothetical protein HYH02_005663 [Chlamydomonas schloesseri]|uniref:MYND-type domain-containing protein n=1 Tax=Chlamydomonas schloesseri TaxID=2026947 RepID=A0A835WM58_9CHLO|nr:hypothetical protein HYH02_005663 [Chlamydomonas schloesseri]|eukprot:KAG2449521.1 hypothetical protein HYH02_005663 [Chlamydomonas schloesseri]
MREAADSLFRRVGDPVLVKPSVEAAAGPAAFIVDSACISISISCEYAAALAALREQHAALKSEVALLVAASGASIGSSSSFLAHEWALGYKRTLDWLQATASKLASLADHATGCGTHPGAAAAHTALVSLYTPWLLVLDAAGAVCAAHGLPAAPPDTSPREAATAAAAASAATAASAAPVAEKAKEAKEQQQVEERLAADAAADAGSGPDAGASPAVAEPAEGAPAAAVQRGTTTTDTAAGAEQAARSLVVSLVSDQYSKYKWLRKHLERAAEAVNEALQNKAMAQRQPLQPCCAGGSSAAGAATRASPAGRAIPSATSGGGPGAAGADSSSAGDTAAADGPNSSKSVCSSRGSPSRFVIITCASTGFDVRACGCDLHDPQKLSDIGRETFLRWEAVFVPLLASAECGGLETLPARAAAALRGPPADAPPCAAEGEAVPDALAVARLARARDNDMDALALSLLKASSWIIHLRLAGARTQGYASAMPTGAAAARFGQPTQQQQQMQASPDAPLRAALGSREVRQLQVALLERLAVHGGSGSSSGSGIQGWLARHEAREGRIVEGGTESAMGKQQQLEERHALWLHASFGMWTQAEEAAWGDPPPPLALQLRLAARAAEALCRLSGCAGNSSASHGSSSSRGGSCGGTQQQHNAVGLGLGGASYGPDPSFTAVCGNDLIHPDFFAGAFRCSAQLRALPSAAAREALLPDALAGAAWWLRLQAAALRRHQPAWLVAVGSTAASARAASRAAAATGANRTRSTAVQDRGGGGDGGGVSAGGDCPAPGEARADGGSGSDSDDDDDFGPGDVHYLGRWVMKQTMQTLWRSADSLLKDMASSWSNEEDNAGLLHEASSHCRAAALAVARRTGLLATLDQLLRLAVEAQLALHDCSSRSCRSAFGVLGAHAGAAAASALQLCDYLMRLKGNTAAAAAGPDDGPPHPAEASGGGISRRVAAAAGKTPPQSPPAVGLHKLRRNVQQGIITAATGADAEIARTSVEVVAAASASASMFDAAAWVLVATAFGSGGRRNAAGPAAAPAAISTSCAEDAELLGLLVTCAKRALALARRLGEPQAVGAVAAGQRRSPAAEAGGDAGVRGRSGAGGGGDNRRAMCEILSVIRSLVASQVLHRRLGSAVPILTGPAGLLGTGGAGGAGGAGGTGREAAAALARHAAAAAEAHGFVLRAVCELGARAAQLPCRPELADASDMTVHALNLWACAAEDPTPAGTAAAAPGGVATIVEPMLPAPQLFACQPHRLIAAAADRLVRLPLDDAEECSSGGGNGGSAALHVLKRRHNLTRGLLRALAAVGSHPLMSIELLTWLAPPPPPAVPRSEQQRAEAAAAFEPDSGPLRGCLRERLRSAVPFMLVVDSNALPGRPEANWVHAAAIAGLLELAAGWAQSCGDSSSTNSKKGGGSGKRNGAKGGGSNDGALASGSGAAAAVAPTAKQWRHGFRRFCKEVQLCLDDQLAVAAAAGDGGGSADRSPAALAEGVLTPALAGLQLPVTGVPLLSLLGDEATAGKKPTTAERVRQRRLQQEAGGGAGGTATGVQWAAPPLPPPLDIQPAALALWRLRVCGNAGCEAFGSSRCEAELDLRLCGRCKSVRYCSTACQAAHWRSGHGAVCGRVAAAVAAVCEEAAD